MQIYFFLVKIEISRANWVQLWCKLHTNITLKAFGLALGLAYHVWPTLFFFFHTSFAPSEDSQSAALGLWWWITAISRFAISTGFSDFPQQLYLLWWPAVKNSHPPKSHQKNSSAIARWEASGVSLGFTSSNYYFQPFADRQRSHQQITSRNIKVFLLSYSVHFIWCFHPAPDNRLNYRQAGDVFNLSKLLCSQHAERSRFVASWHAEEQRRAAI